MQTSGAACFQADEEADQLLIRKCCYRATLDPSCKRAPIMRAFLCSFGSRLAPRSADFDLIASLQLVVKSTRLLAVNKRLL